MAKEAMSTKIENAIQSATNDFYHWEDMEKRAWESLARASEAQVMMGQRKQLNHSDMQG